MVQDELSKLMTWKLKKGKWRPRLQQFVDDLIPEDVIRITTGPLSIWGPFRLVLTQYGHQRRFRLPSAKTSKPHQKPYVK